MRRESFISVIGKCPREDPSSRLKRLKLEVWQKTCKDVDRPEKNPITSNQPMQDNKQWRKRACKAKLCLSSKAAIENNKCRSHALTDHTPAIKLIRQGSKIPEEAEWGQEGKIQGKETNIAG